MSVKVPSVLFRLPGKGHARREGAPLCRARRFPQRWRRQSTPKPAGQQRRALTAGGHGISAAEISTPPGTDPGERIASCDSLTNNNRKGRVATRGDVRAIEHRTIGATQRVPTRPAPAFGCFAHRSTRRWRMSHPATVANMDRRRLAGMRRRWPARGRQSIKRLWPLILPPS